MTTAAMTFPARSERRRIAGLALAALGVVYGDIGTSPLYAVRECFFGPHAVAPTRAHVLGALSLIFWTIAIVVTVKYHLYVLRADHRGEGGILALMTLVRRRVRGRARTLLVFLGLFGAALLYADGVLTPAISVLGALEGLTVVQPAMEPLVVPVTVAVLLALFAFQRRGTAGVGGIFGPVMLVWFATLAVLGFAAIVREPSILAAIDPRYGIAFLAGGEGATFLVLGAIFLVATGGEALYADLGHFGEKPIQIDWFGLVGISLLLNYFGQGALLLADPTAAENPFFRLAPESFRLPLLALATAAAVIAYQAIISGAFSLTRQAVQLGYLPRVDVVHTSATEIGQIYVPSVNRWMAAATIAVVVGFGSSSAVAGAYGVALTATMLITTLLAAVFARKVWRWPLAAVTAVTAMFLVPDTAFFLSALAKVPDGGWFPIVLALGVLAVMTSWERGHAAMARAVGERRVDVAKLIEEIDRHAIERVPGAAVFLTADAHGAPPALLHNLKINRVAHEKNLFLTLEMMEEPYVADGERLEVRELGRGFHRAVARYGFMESPDVPVLLGRPELSGLGADFRNASFVLSGSQLVSSPRSTLSRWRRALFVALHRNAETADRYFRLPPDQVLDIGMVVEI